MFFEPFQELPLDHLLPIEEFLYEKYRYNLEVLPPVEHMPASLKALTEKYPDLAGKVDEFCRRVKSCTVSQEETYLDSANDLNAYTHLRYLPKPSHSHQFFEILYIAEGECENQIEDTQLTLKKGDFCFIAPGVFHELKIYNHYTIAYNLVVRTSTFQKAFRSIYGNDDVVSKFFTENLYKGGSGTTPYIMAHTNAEPVYMDTIRRLVAETQIENMFQRQYLNLLFNELMLELLRRHEKDFTLGKSTSERKGESIVSILRYIQDNYQSVTLSDAASYFNYSSAHLSRIINKYTNQNFSDLVKSIRLKCAVQMLQSTDKSIAEIAIENGYTDSSHFYKVFKEYYNMTPVKYRESYSK